MTPREKAREELLAAAQSPRWIVWAGATSALLLLVIAVLVLGSAAHFIMKYW